MGGNLKEIARLSGVAASSVSRALSGKPGVSDEKRAEILALARRLAYRPNREAQTLRTGRSSDLLILAQATPTEIASYRNHALIAFGNGEFERVRVAVVGIRESVDPYLRRAAEEGVAAVITSGITGTVSPETVNRIVENGVALVLLDSTLSGLPADLYVDRVDIDRESGAYAAGRLLARAGGRTYLFCKESGRRRDPKSIGVERAFADAGTPLPDTRFISVVGDDFAEGYATASELLEASPVDRLFCHNDKLAVGALKALSDAGRRVPEDVMVVGFDDLSFAPYLAIPLTTVAQPVVPCAEAAIELALSRRSEPDRESEHRHFRTTLVIRNTALESIPNGGDEHSETIREEEK